MEAKTYTTVQELGEGKINFFHQGCIYLIENTVKNSNNVKYYYNLNNCFLFEYIIYCVMAKLNFQQPLLQSQCHMNNSSIK